MAKRRPPCRPGRARGPATMCDTDHQPKSARPKPVPAPDDRGSREYHRRMTRVAIGLFCLLACIVTARILSAPQLHGPRVRWVKPTSKLMLWHANRDTPMAEWIARMARRLERQYPEVEVTIVSMVPRAFETKLRTAICADALPDILQTPGGALLASRAHAKELLDLTRQLHHRGWRKSFLSPALELCKDRGQYYAVPVTLDAVLLWCNTKVLSSLALTCPQTLAEMRVVCKRLQAAGLVPLSIGDRDRSAGSEILAYLANRLGGQSVFPDPSQNRDGCAFTHPSFIRACELLHGCAAHGCFGPSFAVQTRAKALADFCSGQAGIALASATAMARAAHNSPELAEHVRCLSFPSVPDGGGDPAAVLARVEVAFAVSQSCTESHYALRLLRMLGSADMGADLMRAGLLSAVEMPPALAIRSPFLERAAAVLSTARDVQCHYADYLSDRMYECHKDAAHQLLTGQTTPLEAVERLQALADGLARGEP